MTAVRLNALALEPSGAGVSTYIRELLRAYPPEWQRACTALVQDDAVVELPSLVRAEKVASSRGARRALSGLVQRTRGDLLHGMDADLPLLAGGPMVATVHDLSVFDVPWAFPAARVRGEQLLVRHGVRRADVVLAVSEFTAERVKAVLGRECRVTPLAPSGDMVPAAVSEVERVRERYSLPSRFVLHVGTVEPRKDVPRLAAACVEAGLPLVLVGARDAVLAGDVRRLGYVPRADLPALYGAATVTAYVSRYEGFGLPPVEALACGARVVATPVADLPLLLGDSVVWVGGDDVASALREAAAGERPPGPTLSWEPAVRTTLAAYVELGATPAP